MNISMSAIWDETIVLVKRERQLLIPLSLATIGIGSAASALIQPEPNQAASATIAFAATLAANLLKLIGSLAIIALVLKPGLSVAESIRLAFSRMPKMLGVILLYLFAILVILLPALLAANPGSLSAKTALTDISALAALLGVIGFFVIIYLGMRLVTLNVIIIDRNPPVWTAVKDAFAQSRGLATKLIGVLLLFVFVNAVVTGATVAVLGTLFGALGKALALPFLGQTIAALAGGMIEALMSILLAVFITKFYQKLATD